jgi:hypothetical protein
VLQGGSAEAREAAAGGLGDLVEMTSTDTLKPFVIQITGPLIRIIGDKFAWQVKAAILSTLAVMIRKGGLALKPFLPQLQTTFMKCLQDAANTVQHILVTRAREECDMNVARAREECDMYVARAREECDMYVTSRSCRSPCRTPPTRYNTYLSHAPGKSVT